MKCLKCGVNMDKFNVNRKSCRVHNYNSKGKCTRCSENSNCYHEWVYFYNFWWFIEYIKFIIKNKFETKKISEDKEYVIL